MHLAESTGDKGPNKITANPDKSFVTTMYVYLITRIHGNRFVVPQQKTYFQIYSQLVPFPRIIKIERKLFGQPKSKIGTTWVHTPNFELKGKGSNGHFGAQSEVTYSPGLL